MARLAEVAEATIAGDEVEEIAMLARGGIGPMAGRAGSGLRPGEPNIEAAAGRVVDVADDPVAALAAAVGEIIAAHGLGMAREMPERSAA